MGDYRFRVHVGAPPEHVFRVWTDLDRAPEWIGGLTRISDLTGPPDEAGTRYVAWFGRMASPTEVLEVDRPRLIRTRFGNRLLRGETRVTFEPEAEGTRVTHELRTAGLISALAARLFATGSYKGSFQGELEDFARLAEREVSSGPMPEGVAFPAT